MFSLYSPTDRIELALAIAILVFALTWKRWLQEPLARFAAETGWCMITLAILPVALRLLLLPNYPIPTPNVADDFSYVLLADTLRHLRFANPLACSAPVLRDVVRDSTAELQLDVSTRPGHGARRSAGFYLEIPGRESLFRWGRFAR